MNGGNPVPINGTSNLIHNGRPKGSYGKCRKVLKQALILAAEKSKHSQFNNLEDYCLFLADEKPELFVSLLVRMMPRTTKIHEDDPGYHDLNIIDSNMPISEMMSVFERRIKSAYMPVRKNAPRDPDEFIEHRDPEDDCGQPFNR